MFDDRMTMTPLILLLLSVFSTHTVYCQRREIRSKNDEKQSNYEQSGRDGIHRRERLINTLFNDTRYNGRIPPTIETGEPVHVKVQMHILSIDTIRESTMDFSMGMFIRQTWNDTRLMYREMSNIQLLELDNSLMSKVWVPDLFFPSEKKGSLHQVTVPNKLMHIYPNGRIQYSQRITATMKCNFDLRKFPMDDQHCSVQMESYGYTTETLEFRWNEEPVQLMDHLEIPQFDLGHLETNQCDKVYIGVSYTCVELQIHLHRNMGYYVTQVYVPSVLIVILSWVSFWLDFEAVPARISLGLLTVLTMTTQSSGARANLPKVSYIKAIGVWMAVCLIFVFMALVQFAYVNVLSRVQKRRMDTIDKIAIGCTDDPGEPTKDETANMIPKPLLPIPKPFLPLKERLFPAKERARNVDKLSRILFPSVFIMFNIVYWSVYLLWEPGDNS